VVKLKTNNYQNLPYGTTPLKKIPSVTQTSLLVGKGSMFGPLSSRNISINMGTEALVAD
jgi:hypothetical protein